MPDEYLIVIILAVLGCMFGSFAGAQVWRLRAGQLVEDKNEGDEVDKAEYKRLLPLTKKSVTSDRSQCLSCGKTLAWYDLLPLISWLSTGGKCRYCKASIGKLEPLIELGVSSVFVASYLLWPAPFANLAEVVVFVLWLAAVVMLAVLFAYDMKWFLLPDKLVFPLIGTGVVISIIRIVQSGDYAGSILSVAGATMVLSGLYYLLWLGSKGQWVGFGDVKLGLGLALLLSDWKLALLALFLANLIGSLIVIPGIATGKLGRKAHVPFGPLLIAGVVISALVGQPIIDFYINVAL